MSQLGTAASAVGDYELAEAAQQESLQLAREVGSPLRIAAALANVGEAVWERGDARRAEAYHEEALAMFRELGYGHMCALVLHNLAKALLSQGDTRGAMARAREGLLLTRDAEGEAWSIGVLLGMCAQALSAGRDAVAASTLMAASRKILAGMYTPTPGERALEERVMERGRTTLDEAEWQRAWTAGEALTPTAAVDFALARIDAAHEEE